MELALRRHYGYGMGDAASDALAASTDYVFTSAPELPASDAQIAADYAAVLASGASGGSDTVPATDAQIAADYAAVLASGASGGYNIDTSTAAGKAALAAAIASLAKTGVQAVASNPLTGACPVGYSKNGALCVGPPGSAQMIAGVSNSTLAIAALVLALLLMGGRR